MVLEAYKLLDLKEKFVQAGVTSDVIWDLSQDEIMKDVGLNNIQLRRFLKAQQNFKSTHSKDIGQQASVDTYGMFHKVVSMQTKQSSQEQDTE